MVFIPPPPKELQKNNLQNDGTTRPQNPNSNVVRPLQEPLNSRDDPQKEKKAKKEKKEKKEKVVNKERKTAKGKVVLCVVGLLASLALAAFVVYLLVF